MTTYRLHFFSNLRARGEFPRLLFIAAGVDYEDVRVERHGKEWDDKKTKMPAGTLPVLEFDGQMFGESVVIARYLARKFGLQGKGHFAQLLTDTIVDKIIQVREQMTAFMFEKDEEKKAAAALKFKDEQLPHALNLIEKLADTNKASNGFLVGDQLTWADLAVFDILEHLVKYNPNVLDNYPRLAAVYKLVPTLPRLDDYLKNRPETQV